MKHRDLWIDFNEVDEHSRAHALMEYATPGAKIGQGATVVVGDDEGNRCRAQVVSVDGGGLIELAIDGNTFERPAKAADPSLVGA
jgi:hypothetical protein